MQGLPPRPLGLTDSAGRRLHFVWNDQGLLLEVRLAPGVAAGQRHEGGVLVRYAYDTEGNLSGDSQPNLAAATDALGGIRCYHATDNQALPVGEYFDALADHFHLPRAPRVSREVLQASVSPALWSFLRESRQLDNHRLSELGYHLKYPTIYSLLTTLCDSAAVG